LVQTCHMTRKNVKSVLKAFIRIDSRFSDLVPVHVGDDLHHRLEQLPRAAGRADPDSHDLPVLHRPPDLVHDRVSRVPPEVFNKVRSPSIAFADFEGQPDKIIAT